MTANGTRAGEAVTRRDVLALCVIVIIGTALRFYRLDDGCVWYDELWHAELANGHGSAHLRLPTNTWVDSVPNYVSSATRGSVPDVWRSMDQVLHPPLYHTVLHFWRAAFGDSTFALRSFSAAMSTLAILLTFVAARLSIGTRGALWASVIMALSAAQLGQAQDGRGYTMLLCLGLVGASLLLRLNQRDRSLLLSVAVALVALAMMFTHYFAFAACAAMGLFALFCLPTARARAETAAALVAAAIVFVVAWGPSVRDQLNCVPRLADVFLKDDSAGFPIRFIERFVASPARLLVESTELGLLVLSIAGLVLTALLFAAFCCNRHLRLWLLWLAAPIVVLAAMDLGRKTMHLDFVRYYLIASPAVAIAIASLWNRKDWLRWAPPVITLACASTVWLGFSYRLKNPDPRLLCQYLQDNVTERDTLILCSDPAQDGYHAKCVYLYLAHYTKLFPRPLLILTGPASQDLVNRLPVNGDVFIVSGDPSLPTEQAVSGAQVIERFVYNRGGAVLRIRRN